LNPEKIDIRANMFLQHRSEPNSVPACFSIVRSDRQR
jgi:hypothetical protein